MVTGGGTRPVRDGLRLETLVSAMPAALHAPLQVRKEPAIVELCQTPRSVAEIAVSLAVPLGVARVLIADLATAGFVTIQDPPSHHVRHDREDQRPCTGTLSLTRLFRGSRL